MLYLWISGPEGFRDAGKIDLKMAESEPRISIKKKSSLTCGEYRNRKESKNHEVAISRKIIQDLVLVCEQN